MRVLLSLMGLIGLATASPLAKLQEVTRPGRHLLQTASAPAAVPPAPTTGTGILGGATPAPVGLTITGSDIAPNCTQLLNQGNINTLNYALTLEHLEATFYSTFQANFTSAMFVAAGYKAADYLYFNLIASHEAAHVAALNATIVSLGGEAATPCVYNFSMITNVTEYVAIAKVLENTGVSAYDGAINSISDDGLRTVAATIATVEGRHAAYLNQLNGAIPFPNPFDTPLLPTQVLGAAAGFFVSCPYTIVLPNKVVCE